MTRSLTRGIQHLPLIIHPDLDRWSKKNKVRVLHSPHNVQVPRANEATGKTPLYRACCYCSRRQRRIQKAVAPSVLQEQHAAKTNTEGCGTISAAGAACGKDEYRRLWHHQCHISLLAVLNIYVLLHNSSSTWTIKWKWPGVAATMLSKKDVTHLCAWRRRQ